MKQFVQFSDVIQDLCQYYSVFPRVLFWDQLCLQYTQNLYPICFAKHPVYQHSFLWWYTTQPFSKFCNIDSTIKSTWCCTSDSQGWMIQNRRQLNKDKTEALLVTTSSRDRELPASIQRGSSIVPFVRSVKNLGVTLDSEFSMKERLNRVCQMAWWELRRISSTKRYLTDEAAKTLVASLLLSRLGNGNCLLAGVPDCLLHKLQKIQNASARLTLRSARGEHSKPLLKRLHWLPISDRIKYKLSSMR